jgi:hypothetical protein
MVTKGLAGRMNAAMTEYYTKVRDDPKRKAVEAIERSNPELLEILGIESPAPQDPKKIN